MKIILDNIIFALQRSGGISVVWYELISRILRNRNEDDIQCLNYRNTNIFYETLKNKGLIKESFINLKKPFERYQPLPFREYKSNFIFHSSYYRYSTNPNAINITTVHDFTYEYYNKGLKKYIHSWQKKKAILKSDYIICISENTKKDLLHFIPKASEKRIKVIYNGVSDDYYPIKDKKILKHIKLPFVEKSFIVFIGSRASYKNFDLAVKAVSESPYNFLIIGSPLNKDEETLLANNFKDKQRYSFIGHVTNEILNQIYNTAYALLYPSIYEGFGIPVIEAQKSGCPVIAFNGSSIPEIIGDTTLLMHETTSDEILRCLSLLSSTKLRESVINNGFENAKRFSWDNMYNEIINVYIDAWKQIPQKSH
ncbi:glycosyltransferase family 4 protein [Phocaeicola coprophilus]|uniref:glycosyltransferase family 4 protein n=1 Tax=Phocaeicola coprophilus TaxID=387090 RepID=UPI0026DDAD94|nr:glycosyltransferase family 1 protein [Phocaeicola coprophilus]